MPGLAAGIHEFPGKLSKSWTAGTSPAIAYVSAVNLKKGDTVEISLSNDEEPLLTNSETLAEDRATYLLQAGKRGVPAGGWPSEWKYFAKLKITRDGKVLIEQATDPIPFE
jgi:hypothetical protein